MKDYEVEISKHIKGPIPLPELEEEEQGVVDVHESGDRVDSL